LRGRGGPGGRGRSAEELVLDDERGRAAARADDGFGVLLLSRGLESGWIGRSVRCAHLAFHTQVERVCRSAAFACLGGVVDSGGVGRDREQRPGTGKDREERRPAVLAPNGLLGGNAALPRKNGIRSRAAGNEERRNGSC